MKTAIWAAVSTAAQASPDKISIEHQLKTGRQLIASKGWTPAGEYIVPGESRTRYISLYHAEKNIPQLNQLLEAAQRKEFDLLYIYDLNRFRTLMRQVFDALSDYGIQLYIHTNPREPVPPEQYNEEHKQAVGMIVDLTGIISRSEISNIQRHYREKMPERINRGLHAGIGGPPYGYRKIHPLDRQTPYIQEPLETAILIEIKDRYLSGESINAIAKDLNRRAIPTRNGGKWQVGTIRHMLASPYYAGFVYFARQKTHRDRRTNKKTTTPNPSPSYAQGKHQPLWDVGTHQTILQLIEQRASGYQGNRTHRLTSLLVCTCGKVLHSTFRKTKADLVWRCSSRLPGHTRIRNDRAIAAIIPRIIQELQTLRTAPAPPQKKDTRIEDLQRQIEEIKKRQEKLLDLYETDRIDKDLLHTRAAALKKRLDTTRSLLAKAQAIAARSASARSAIQQLAQLIDRLPVYLTEAPPARVNTALRTAIECITITSTNSIKIHWRT